MRLKTTKLLKENTGENLDVGPCSELLHVAPKTQATKPKIDNLDYIKLKSFYSAVGTINNGIKCL